MKLLPTPRPAIAAAPDPSPPELSGADLRTAVSGLSKVVGRKGGLPVLREVRVETVDLRGQGRRLRLSATDLDLTLHIDLPLSPSSPSPAITAPHLVPLDRLRDWAKATAPRETIAIRPVRGATPAKDWPAPAGEHLEALENAPSGALPDAAVTALLRAFACASHDSTRYVLQSAYLDVSDTRPHGHRIVATDGRQLFSSNSLRLDGIRESIILPHHPVWTWKALADSRPWSLRLGNVLKSGRQSFRIDGPFWSITGLTIDGHYPNYRQVIPADGEFKTRITLAPESVAGLARVLPVLPGAKLRERPVGLEVTEDGVVQLLCRDSHDEPWEARPIAGARVSGPPERIFAHRDYLARAFGFGLDQVDVIDPLGPIRLSRGGELMIVMPQRAVGQPGVNRPATPYRPIGAAPQPIPKPNKPNIAPQPTPQRKAPNMEPPVPTSPSPSAPSPDTDPLADVETRLTAIRQALDGARQGLVSVATALKLARQQRHKTQRDLQAVRNTLRTLQRVDL